MRLGRYVLQGRIGAGGMAEVFLARQEGPGGFARRVAIKFVHPDREDPELLRSLLDEAQVAANLKHPNIVQVIDLDRFGDGFYLVMEYLEGLPLDRLMRLARTREQRPGLDAVVDLGLQLLDALDCAHSARGETGAPLRVVHRDVKPSNVIVDGLGLAKLVDFGIARAESLERRTATGIGKGTPAYMAPEQLRGEAVGAATDLFAVGVVLTELVLERQLFTADNFMALITRRTEGLREEDRAELRERMPELEPVLTRALAEEPEERFEGAAAMVAALRELSAAPPRKAVHAWMTRVLGDDPAELFASASQSGSSPTRVADGAEPGPGVAPEAGGGTREVGSDWLRKEPEPDPEVPTTRPMARGTPGPTVLVPAPEGRLVAVGPRTRLVFGAGLLLLVAGLFVVLARPWQAEDERPGPVNPDQHLSVVVEVTPTPAEAAPTATPAPPTPSPTAAPSPRVTPSPTVAEARPTPQGERSSPGPQGGREFPRRPTPTPAPTPAPSPTPAPTVPLDASASGALSVGLMGIGGTVEVVGHGLRQAPTGEIRLPPGVHRVRLLDRHGDLLREVAIEVRSGEISRCVWKNASGALTRVADPRGAPCRVR